MEFALLLRMSMIEQGKTKDFVKRGANSYWYAVSGRSVWAWRAIFI